ncbi:hypothetical protein V7O61_01430 [Methanolobus sp. WCC1]|nr:MULTISPECIES: hypothetical protein [Methanolobus]
MKRRIMLSSDALTPGDHPIGMSAVLPSFPRDRLYRTIQYVTY